MYSRVRFLIAETMGLLGISLITGASWNLTDHWGFLESHRSLGLLGISPISGASWNLTDLNIPLVTEELAWFVD